MTVKELIAFLMKCSPEADVEFPDRNNVISVSDNGEFVTLSDADPNEEEYDND